MIMSNNEELVKLESILGILDKKITNLNETKQKLDDFKRRIDEVYEKECSFRKLLSTCKKHNERLLLFFEGSEETEALKLIDEELDKIDSNYKQKQQFFEENLASKGEFSEDKLDKYSREITEFLSPAIERLDTLAYEHESIFNKAKKEISEKINVLNRLLNTLLKKVEELPHGSKLKEFIDEEQNQLQEILTSIPSELEEIDKKDKNLIQGAYTKVKNDISEHRGEIRRFAVDNNLLSEDEAILLETVYEIQGREFEFTEVISILKEKLPFGDEEKIQKLMLELSKKGFILLKVITE